jgi:hypothetical protein
MGAFALGFFRKTMSRTAQTGPAEAVTDIAAAENQKTKAKHMDFIYKSISITTGQ